MWGGWLHANMSDAAPPFGGDDQGAMDNIIATTEALLREHQLWAGVVICLIAFGESLVLIGMFVPATALMLLIGGLAGSGVIEPLPVVLGAIAGAVLGDIVSYFIGRWMGPSVVHKWPLKKYREGVAKARLFFRKYGFAAVFFGRFFGPLRCSVPLVAGMMAMDQKRFQIANVGSAMLWAPVMLAPGWIAAKGASQFGEMSSTHWIGLSVAATVIAIAFMFVVGFVARSAAPRRRKPARA